MDTVPTALVGDTVGDQELVGVVAWVTVRDRVPVTVGVWEIE